RRVQAPRGRSERDVVVRTAAEIVSDRVVGRDGGAGSSVIGCPLAAATQHLDVLSHDLGGVPLLTLLVLPLAGAGAALPLRPPAPAGPPPGGCGCHPRRSPAGPS